MSIDRIKEHFDTRLHFQALAKADRQYEEYDLKRKAFHDIYVQPYLRKFEPIKSVNNSLIKRSNDEYSSWYIKK